jgi:hypothetical protein
MRRAAIPFVVLLLLALVCCRTQTQAGAKQQGSKLLTRDLSIDEDHGGHTLARHVGRTDDQLRDRLEHEQNISAASTYTDRQTAERAVAMAIRDERQKIDRWMERGSRRPNLVVDYTDPDDAVGRVMYRRAMGSVPCDHAIAVLKADGPRDYYVLTSYPECRP